MDKKSLRQAQLAQLLLAKETKKICEKHNLNYFLLAGSALGAVRHKGFIPWDDDLDIGMLREDYDKFMEYAKEELPKAIFMQTWDTDENYALPFLKLRLEGTKFVERNTKDVDLHKGIYIDIFPFDNVPADEQAQKKQAKETSFYWKCLLAKNHYVLWDDKDWKKKSIYRLVRMATSVMSKKQIQAKIDAQMLAYNRQKTEEVVAIGGSYGYWKEKKKRLWLETTEIVRFEDDYFPIPKAYDAYLKSLYGDYMKLPPEDQRENRHNICEFDLGNYTFEG